MTLHTRRTLEVYYDGWCPLCTGIRTRLERWDWLHVLQFHSIREPYVMERMPVSIEKLEANMHVREIHSGRIRSGIDAVFALSVRVPLLMPMSPFIWLSMKLGFGNRLYMYVASRRTIVPAGQCDYNSCKIPKRSDPPVDEKNKHSN